MFLLRKWRFLLLASSALLLTGCNLPWQKNISGLQIEVTEGAKAQVYLNELHLGETPVNRDNLKPGVYKVKLEPSGETGKQPYETEIHLYPGALTTILWSFKGSEPSGTGDILELEPLSTSDRAELSVITVPEGASVALNSTTYGLSPVILDTINPGDYSLTVTAVGHARKTFSAKVTKGFRLHVFSRLDKESTETIAAPTATPTPIVLNENVGASPRPTPLVTPTPKPTPKSTPIPNTPVATTSTALVKPYVTIKDTGTGWLRVRDQASSAGSEVARVTVGASYPYVSTLNGWYEIEYLPNARGWISGQYASIVR